MSAAATGVNSYVERNGEVGSTVLADPSVGSIKRIRGRHLHAPRPGAPIQKVVAADVHVRGDAPPILKEVGAIVTDSDSQAICGGELSAIEIVLAQRTDLEAGRIIRAAVLDEFAGTGHSSNIFEPAH